MYGKLKSNFLIINFLLMIINIIYLISKTKKIKKNKNYNEYELFQFKNSDYFFLDLINNKYKDISNYLNKKFNIKKKGISLINLIFSKKKTISIDIISFDFHIKWIKEKLRHKFIIKFNSDCPDYLIYNVVETKHLNPKYKNSNSKINIITKKKICYLIVIFKMLK